MIRRDRMSKSGDIAWVRIPELQPGANLFGKFIIVKHSNGFTVFSNKCTHLGCRIQQLSGNKLICPCHGSQFDPSTGSPLKGPASNNLEELRFEIREDMLEIWVS
jgi:Rieske Fe-S protein